MNKIINFPVYLNKKIVLDYLVPFFIFLIFFVIGLNVYKDYGISFDEDFHRETGRLYYYLLKSFFINLDLSEKAFVSDIKTAIQEFPLIEGRLRLSIMTPALFDTIVEFYIDLKNITAIEEVFFIRHLFNFLFFLVGCYFFYLILLKIFENKVYVYLGVLFLFFSPRIFSESFYNNKDIVFLSVTMLFIFFSIKFFEKKSYLNAILFGIFSALAFVTRLPAIVYIFATYLMFFLQSMDDEKFLITNYKFLAASLLTTIIFVYIFWPYLWIDPFNHLFHFLKVVKAVMPGIQNYYLGEYFSFKNSPWHYNLIWIIVTIPISITIFFTIGFFKILINAIKNLLLADQKNHKFWNSKKEMFDYYFLIITLLVIIAKIKFGVDYDGWRQIYFLYPFIVLIALNGVCYVNSKLKFNRMVNVIFLALSLELFFLIFWIYKYHPHQYVFFNPFFKNLVVGKMELDYWGVSNRSSLEFINKTDNRNKIKIATISFASLENTLRIMNKNDRKKLLIVHDLNHADYAIDSYRKKWNKSPSFNLLKTKFKKIYDLKIDGNVINSIYKGKN
jgi:hypothetical protein